jgi:hypothetical protein
MNLLIYKRNMKLCFMLKEKNHSLILKESGFAIDINFSQTTSQNEGKIAITISQMLGSKALHHAAPKVRVCNIFYGVCRKCGLSGFCQILSVTSFT